MSCLLCSMHGKVIYEDDALFALLLQSATKSGQIAIATKAHKQIISQIDDMLVAKMFVLAKKLAELFPHLKIEAFNFLANNRADPNFHFSLNLIPRKKEDGLNLQWAQKQMTPEQMAEVASALENLPISFDIKKEPPKSIAKAPEKIVTDKEDYRLLQFDRQP